MTPNTMTLDEVRDELSRRDGWTREDPIENTGIYVWCKPHANYAVKEWCNCHPHPATLDGAAAALPNGWTWMRDGTWWIAVPPGSVSHWNHVKVPDTGDPIADFFRLALACRIAEEGK